jgi:hypothetical protein
MLPDVLAGVLLFDTSHSFLVPEQRENLLLKNR